ncbi:hypothetical protein ACHAWF_011600 [Thalassiosira exigua]
MSIITLTILGVSNIWTMRLHPRGIYYWVFLSFNTFFLGFSFLFGVVASNYFEGLLLIYPTTQYHDGQSYQRLFLSALEIVLQPVLQATIQIQMAHQHGLLTVSLCSLLRCVLQPPSKWPIIMLRIINTNRWPKAIISILIKFGLETLFHNICFPNSCGELHQSKVEALAGFRPKRVEADYGYIEYKIIAQHRENWMSIGLLCAQI